jgi:hypothetical protein
MNWMARPLPAYQSGEPPLALDQRQVAQVVVAMPDQVEREQHRLMTPTSFRSAGKSGVLHGRSRPRRRSGTIAP